MSTTYRPDIRAGLPQIIFLVRQARADPVFVVAQTARGGPATKAMGG
jgi:hypothetical protein